MNRAMRFCGCAANLGRLNLMRAAYLAHMQYSEFNRHMEELGATGKTVVDGAVVAIAYYCVIFHYQCAYLAALAVTVLCPYTRHTQVSAVE